MHRNIKYINIHLAFPVLLMVFLIPNTKSLWVKQAKGLKCDRTTIHELEDQFVTSASEIGDKQYLTLRVLWVRRTTLDCPAPFKDREARWKEALSFLTENEAWQQYWKDFRATSIDIKTPGALSIVRFYQKASYRDPEAIVTNRELRQLRKKVSPISRRQAYWSKSDDSDSQGDDGDPQDNDSDSQEDDSDPEDVKDEVSTTGKMTVGGPYTPIISSRAFVASPHTPATHALSSPAEDEAIVNTAFLLFLQGLCIWHPRLFLADNDIPQWTMKRLELIFNLGEEGGGNPKKGSLKVEMNPKERQKGEKRGSVKKKRGWKARTDGFLRLRDKAVIIIEVKPHLRATRPSDIQKQEGAQMAAWIRACPEDHYECEEKGRKIRRYNFCKLFL